MRVGMSGLLAGLLTITLASSTLLVADPTGGSTPAAQAAEPAEPAKSAPAVQTAKVPERERDYLSLVDPWVEADIGRFFFFQSASQPFGFVKLRPDTSTHHARDTGYRKNEDQVKGFSHLHDWQLSGVQVMPTTGDPVPKLEGDTGWQSHVRHDDSEIVQPGYHKVHLDRYGVDAELTSTERVGLHRYTYDRSGPSEILVNLGGTLGEADMENAQVTRVGPREIEGFVVQHGETGRYGDVFETKLFFDIRFDRDFDSMHGWADGELVDDGAAIDKVAGENAGAYVRFDQLDAGDQVQMKVGLSLTGAEGARRNLEAELPGWDFDKVRSASQQHWNEMLGRIDVRGGTQQQQTKFYTDLFHVLCGRSLVSDVDGKYIDDTWNRGRVGQIPLDDDGEPKFAMYNYDALWLTQWNVNSVLGMAYPEILNSFVNSQLRMYRDGGLLPRGPVAGNYSMIMTGSPVTSFITGAWNKGIRDFDPDLAYDAMLDAHSIGGLFDKAWSDHANWGTGGNREYLEQGYVPDGVTGNGTGQTLEYAHQDWALAQLAKDLGKTGLNAAQFAEVSVSSQRNDAGAAGERAVDGRPAKAPTSTEWRSEGESNPWIELAWEKPRKLRSIVLRDTADPDSNASSGRLEFGDGSTIDVEDIPADGTAKRVKFEARTVDSVRFTVTGGEGEDVGLDEIEAWDDTDTYQYLLDRSRNWRKLYNPASGFIQPRNADGSWTENFDPLSPRDFVEANSWQAGWFTTHDVMGLANLMGGEAAYADKLNYAFERAKSENFIAGHGAGYVSYGNQPGLPVAHLFNYVGHPWLTQHWVREVKERTYGSTATDDGYGHHDEDQGQMGAMSALMAIGLFEVTGGGLNRPVYDITSPIFDEITIELNQDYYSGDEFRIVTHQNSADNKYIQRARLDGERLNNAWFHHDQFADGGTLELWMGPKPNKKWGVDELPPSESKSQHKKPVYASKIALDGPDRLVEPYSTVHFDPEFTPSDTTLQRVFWSVTAPDGSPTKVADITQDGELTINHRSGDVVVTAINADSGPRVVGKQTVSVEPDPDRARGNAARWPGVKVTASSEHSDGYRAERAVDGVIGDSESGDWASAGEQNPWIQLDWEKPIRADKLRIYDRAGVDDVNGGTLTFSDGSSIKVRDISPTGEGKTVTFEEKTFDRVRFQVEGGTGPNNGLSEFEVYAVPDVPKAPREVTAEVGAGATAGTAGTAGTATVSWRPPAFDGGVPITEYVVTPYRNGTALEPVVVDAEARSARLDGLASGKPYVFTVTARNLTGSGAESQPSNQVRPR